MNRLWHISEIEQTDQNIFFYWDGVQIKRDRNRLIQTTDAIFSTLHFNPDRPIWLISNCEQPEDWPGIRVTRWDNELYSPMPHAEQWAELYNRAGPRDRCDVIRFLLLYKYGGSYVDTDDICLAPMPNEEKNIMCRSYDPHTCHYDGWRPEDCVPGSTRGAASQWQHIPWFPRTDCWYNWAPQHELILNIIKRGSESPERGINTIYSYGDTKQLSWQSLIMLEAKAQLANHGITWQAQLTLLYLPESHVATCCYWDRGDYGGELHQIWPASQAEAWAGDWGRQQYTLEQANQFWAAAKLQWPYMTHMWLHDKGKGISPEWDPRATPKATQLMSTHIIRTIRHQAKIPQV